MFRYISIFIIAFLLYRTEALRSGCPSRALIKPCICHEKTKGLDLMCENTKIELLRDTLERIAHTNQTIMYLKLWNNPLYSLSSSLFVSSNVRHVMIHRSNLSYIDETAFMPIAEELESLDLANNDFKKVPTPAMERLSALTSLNLNYNQLKILPPEAFKGLTALVRLSLYGNKIKYIDATAFRGVSSNLSMINLGGNLLTEIPAQPLRNLISLEKLLLHENHIDVIKPKQFSNLGIEALDALDLSNNKIRALPAGAFFSLRVLNSLDLEHNYLENIHVNAFQGLEDSLEWVKLGLNDLSEIPSSALRHMKRLRQLDLRSNNISRIREDDFKSYGKTLKFIYLQSNRINTVDPASFTFLDSVEYLYLFINQIESFPYETYSPIINTIQVFDIHTNPVTCDCKIAWLRDWMRNKENGVIKNSDKTKCVAPDGFKDMLLVKIPDDKLVCTVPGASSRNHLSVSFFVPLIILIVVL